MQKQVRTMDRSNSSTRSGHRSFVSGCASNAIRANLPAGPGLGRSVRRENRARARHLALDESQWPERTVVAEDSLAAAQDEWVDHQPELIDEVVLDQRLYQLGAPDHLQIRVVLLLQFGHGLGDATMKYRRVLPLERVV